MVRLHFLSEVLEEVMSMHQGEHIGDSGLYSLLAPSLPRSARDNDAIEMCHTSFTDAL